MVIELSVLFFSFIGLIILRVPVFFALGLSSLLTALLLGLSLELVVSQMFEAMNSFTLMAVPFFLLCGQLMNSGKITEKLIRFAQSLVGHIRGGLAHINVLVSMIFAGMSGAAAADTAAVGSIMIPAMIKRGFGKNFTIAITVASSTMGVIIPPSITMIIYGSMGDVSIGGLFLAGALPGLLLGIGQMVFAYWYSVRKSYPAEEWAGVKEIGASVKGAFFPLWIPVIVVGGVISGIFTATEAGMVGAVYTLILVIVVYRSVDFRRLPNLLMETTVVYSLPLMAVSTALVFGWLMAYLEAPKHVADLLSFATHSPTLTVALISLTFLIFGTFMDAIAAIIIFMPVVQRLVEVSGAHPIHAGLVVIMSLAMGLITPPFGLCLLLGSALGKQSVAKVMPMMFVFYGVFIVVLSIIIVFPEISLFLPRLIMPRFVG